MDVTRQKRNEAQIKDYAEDLERRNTELEEFAHVASHDLQEPLRKVSGFCDLLKRNYGDKLDEDAGRWIEFAGDGAARMKALIDALLAYSRVGHNEQVEPIALDAALDEAVSNLDVAIRESGATITRDDLPTVDANRMEMVQLFQNLLSNAIKYRHDGSVSIHVAAEQNGEAWNISVRDDGIGIAPEYREQVFEMFRRLHGRSEYTGTGIGLTTCRKIVEELGGRIWCEPGTGAGSTFTFTIPTTQCVVEA